MKHWAEALQEALFFFFFWERKSSNIWYDGFMILPGKEKQDGERRAY